MVQFRFLSSVPVLLSVWFSVWLVFSSLSCVLLCSLSFSLCVPISLTSFLNFSIFLSYTLSFPLFRYCSTFLSSSFGSPWISFAFFQPLVRLISFSSSSHSLLVLTSLLPPPPRCSFRIAFSLVFCDFLQCNCC